MAKTKTKGTAKTVSDTPVPQPITISSTNPKIMADNIKKLEKAIKGADDASEISYDNTESHLTASNVQAAIDEVVTEIGSITSPDASDVSYDNTDSGLTADDVQDAIDELTSKVIYSFTPDGSTTISVALDALYAEGILTIRSKLKIGTSCFTITELLSAGVFASSSNIYSNKMTTFSASIASSGSKLIKAETTTSGTTFTDLSNDTTIGFTVYNY